VGAAARDRRGSRDGGATKTGTTPPFIFLPEIFCLIFSDPSIAMTSSVRRGDVATQSDDIVAQKRPFCATRQFVAKKDASPDWIKVCNDFGSIFPARAGSNLSVCAMQVSVRQGEAASAASFGASARF
jgi:hypothetical protein